MTDKNEIELQSKDGKKHVLFIRVSKTSWSGTLEELGTNEVEKVTRFVQNNGYEIVDIKFTAVSAMYMSVLVIYQ